MTEKKKAQKIPFVLITNEWIDRWLPVLNGTELKVYLKLAYHYNHEKSLSFPGQKLIGDVIGVKSRKPVINAVKKLEDLGLIETIKKFSSKGWPSNQYRLLHVDKDGYHRSERQQPSLNEALDEWKEFRTFLFDISNKDYETKDGMIKEIETKYPEYIDAIEGLRNDADFRPPENLTQLWADLGVWFEAGYFRRKYKDIMDLVNPKRMKLNREFMKQEHDRWDELLKVVEDNLEKITEDIQYCMKRYTERLKTLRDMPQTTEVEIKAKEKFDRETFKESIELKRMNYGIVAKLATKYGFTTYDIYKAWEEYNEKHGVVGFGHDFDGYIESVSLPDYESALTEEELRFIHLPVEDKIYTDNITGKKEVYAKGFTPAEKRDFKGTLEKIKKAKLKAVNYLVERATTELAKVYLEGRVREIEGGKYKPDIWYWKALGDGSYSREIKRGYHPGEMGLEDLLRYVTHEINDQTQTMREYEDIKDEGVKIDGETGIWQNIDKPREDALVPIPPVTLEQVKAIFEKEKEKALTETEKKEAEKATA